MRPYFAAAVLLILSISDQGQLRADQQQPVEQRGWQTFEDKNHGYVLQYPVEDGEIACGIGKYGAPYDEQFGCKAPRTKLLVISSRNTKGTFKTNVQEQFVQATGDRILDRISDVILQQGYQALSVSKVGELDVLRFERILPGREIWYLLHDDVLLEFHLAFTPSRRDPKAHERTLATFKNIVRTLKFAPELAIGAATSVDECALCNAVREGDVEKIKSLISHGIDVNTRDDRGQTPLHYAQQIIVAELLLERGAEVNARDNKGYAPLHNASRWEDRALAELLVGRGADATARSKNGTTPLHRAARNGRKETVELLITRGADVNAKTAGGGTPLHQAISGTKAVVELLIEHGADVNSLHKHFGSTPLHHAAQLGQAEIADVLLEAGAGIDTKNKKGQTPLHRAAWAGIDYMVELLLAKGADVHVEDNKGLTPLHVALGKGHESVAELLRERVHQRRRQQGS